ncbi:hypothetical protein ACFU6R_27025 [Streptomyces sp. NPDC057499]|uniref:hypothetical protein n=1 Tax=Streptomyces sp. NPDC057499 TaxID=3346150 RepID=UPI0036B5D907
MGIESDQLVYDYLSRVGDLAQQQQLASADRMRLVATLRGEIDRQRGKAAGDSPAAVRRIIGRLGSPDELVAAAAGSGDGVAQAPAGVPAQPPAPEPEPEPAVPRPRRGLLRKEAPRPAADTGAPPEPAEEPGPLPPHRAGTDELGPSRGEPDWWRVEQTPFGQGVDVPGFTGGVEIPAMLRGPLPPAEPGAEAAEEAAAGTEEAEETEGAEEEAPAGKRRRRLPRLVRRAPREDRAPGRGFNHPMLLLAALLLAAGAVTGSWLALAGGWLLAYSSRTLSRAEAKWAAMGLPGTVAAGALLWLWGRSEGRWGEPVAAGQLNAAIDETWPWAVRGAAVASALYLVWRARKPRS